MSYKVQVFDAARPTREDAVSVQVERELAFDNEEDDIFCDFDTLDVSRFSEVSHLWRNAHVRCVDLVKKFVHPTAYDLRENEIASKQISLYEAVAQLKVPEDLNLEAYNINHFLSTQAPLDISSSALINLNVDALKQAAKTSPLIHEFIDSIRKSEFQNENHINAYHWDVTFTTGEHEKLVHIKSVLCQFSTLYPDVKTMGATDFSKKMAKIRKKRERRS